ncbi:MAG: metallophosphoesterase [Desulfosporosinus sp.]|nr:metallophosphoesterase [Desulfosporosinus sp.]
MRGGLSAGAGAYPRPVAPMQVLAGDLFPAGDGNFTEILRRATEGYQLTLFVPGNHEYYGCQGFPMEKLEAMVAKKANALPNVFCLNQKSLSIGDISFIGSTLWTNPPKNTWDFGVGNYNDYHAIKKSANEAYTPADICHVHKRHAAFLTREVAAAKKRGVKNIVVVTHHVPDVRLSKETGSRPSSLFPYYFATDMERLTKDPAIKVWCHGHSHETHCIRLDPWGPLFASNAKGYPNERTGFTNNAIISIRE